MFLDAIDDSKFIRIVEIVDNHRIDGAKISQWSLKAQVNDH